MPRMKMLTSVAHNVAHSYLSSINYIDGEFTVERLFRIASESKQPDIMIDILRQLIEPPIFAQPEINESLIYLRYSLESLLMAENISINDIQSAKIKVSFDVEKTHKSKDEPNRELPAYECVSEIVDIHGKIYKKDVVEWWKY